MKSNRKSQILFSQETPLLRGNSKSQTISKFKISNSKLFRILCLGFGICLGFGALNLVLARPAYAAFFYLEPDTKTAAVGETFDVQLHINTEGEQTTSADVVLLFDQSILEVTNVTAGDFYPQNFKNISSEKIYIGGAVQNATENKTGEGVLSKITFKGKAGGSTSVRFDCTAGKTSDSNISKDDAEATDVLACDKLVNGTYTISGGGPTATPRPTFQPTCSPSPQLSPQPSPTALPPAGVVTPSIFLLGIGSLLTILGFLFTL